MTSRLPATPSASGRRKSAIPGIGTPGPTQAPTRTPMRRSSLAPPLPSSEPRVGTSVEFELSAGETMTGTLRFIGGVEGKAGVWAGVELDDDFAGRGKNDGSVQGTQYFACPPQCGLFLPVAKVRAVRHPPLKVSDLMPAPTSTTRTPRRSLSPTKQPSLSASTPRMPRSTGPLGMPTPTPRRSLGPSTPRLSARPPSRQELPPQVPPIPLAYGLARSVTPSSATTGRMTPARRRTSLATTTASDLPPRSTTPSLRSSSRQSFASSISRQSVSRQSHRADERSFSRQSHRGGADRDGDENELELKQLLDASERLGREMEDRLAEKSRRIKQLEAELAQRADADVTPSEETTPATDPAQTDRIATLEAELAAQLQASQKLKLEAKHKSAAMEAQVESLRERLDAATQEHLQERDQLRSEVDKLRTAGQALCETYEEKIAEIELARLEAVDLVESLQAQLQQQPTTPPVINDTTTTAATIDAETARAEVEHLRSKVGSLEDQLEQVRHQLEQEVGDTRERRARHQEVEAALKEQIRSLKETVDSSNEAEKRAHARIKELQAALAESQSTLEAERSELEGLRRQEDDSTTSALADDLQRAQRDLATSKSELERAERESHQLGELVTRLRQDLRHAEAEIQRLAQPHPSTRNEVNELRIIVDSLTAENKELHDRRGAERTTNQDDDLRKQLEDVQRKSALEIKALKEEITELESLVESQIYNNNDDDKPTNGGSADSDPRRKCEMCGEAGHDLASCPDLTPSDDLVASTLPPHSMPMNGRTDSQEWCDDCEEFGHALENCPLANEIF
ncbi:hypothetical protein RHOSPDRAFT_33944 [Rhodotorula sp. JG-1b]|nr:hypothetical protein RHOSPDRAFT_33944 [Rhodotorula sp. JG-1b]